MRDVIIVDNFYTNPDEVRSFALEQDFNIDGNYPGHRTKSFLNEPIVKYIEEITGFEMEPLEDPGYTGAFQVTFASDRTWIHADSWNEWAGVCYLTPDAPVTGGTGLFKHKATGLTSAPRLPNGEVNESLMAIVESEAQDYTKWELVDVIGNKYNRCVFYKGDMFHASLDYFGKTKEDGRLFQTFFFNSKK
jgi:hypothetical protein